MIADYRAGDMERPTPQHVDRWIGQFPSGVQQPILNEMEHMGHTYFTRRYVTQYISDLISYYRLAGDDPCSFWRGVCFLDIQTAGHSQRDLLEIFDAQLRAQCGFGIGDCGQDSHTYVYLDDALFSGGRIESDLVGWINTSAPSSATIFVITIARHTQGHYITELELAKAIAEAGKHIAFRWVSRYVVEDRKYYTNTSDVLRPARIPPDPATQAYAESLGVGLRLAPPAASVETNSLLRGRPRSARPESSSR